MEWKTWLVNNSQGEFHRWLFAAGREIEVKQHTPSVLSPLHSSTLHFFTSLIFTHSLTPHSTLAYCVPFRSLPLFLPTQSSLVHVIEWVCGS